ncbi:MAG: hypothetical protein ACRELZ_25205 [Candidatus Rokuibacteriota bacterium]
MHRSTLLLMTLALLPSAAGAETNMAGVTYNYSFPAVDIDKYVGADSWYGFTVDFRRRMTGNPNTLVGISSGWHVFYDTVNQVIELDNVAISGDQYRSFNVIPILANATRLLGKDGETRPYVALHAGAYWIEQELDIGLYAYTKSNWHFGMAPEVGVTFPVRTDGSVYFNARYHYPLSGGDYLGGDSLTLPFLTLGVGIAWTS